jgi:calcineurin-like phosphoesterase family protein
MEKYNNIYITTDWHLNHENVINYDDRPDNFQELLLENFSKTCKEDDLIINLGDVIFKEPSYLGDFLNNIKGTHILLMGNHDRNKPAWYKNKGFHKVCNTYVNGRIVFSHKPKDLNYFKQCQINIHGHFHENIPREDRDKNFYPFYSDNHFCLTISEMNYKPVLLKDFLIKRNLKIENLLGKEIYK